MFLYLTQTAERAILSNSEVGAIKAPAAEQTSLSSDKHYCDRCTTQAWSVLHVWALTDRHCKTFNHWRLHNDNYHGESASAQKN